MAVLGGFGGAPATRPTSFPSTKAAPSALPAHFCRCSAPVVVIARLVDRVLTYLGYSQLLASCEGEGLSTSYSEPKAQFLPPRALTPPSYCTPQAAILQPATSTDPVLQFEQLPCVSSLVI